MPQKNRSETIRLDLTNRILSSELKPGDHLDEQNIADTYEVSRTPVREVLQQLSASGLVEIIPRRGAFVRQLSRQEIMDLFEAMGELEAICAKLAAGRMTLIEIGELERLVEKGEQLVRNGEGGEYSQLNLSFHQAIFEGAHNSSLLEMANILRLRTSPYRNAQFGKEMRARQGDDDRLVTSQKEHQLIFEALQNKDPEAAYRAMNRHITTSSLTVSRMVATLESD